MKYIYLIIVILLSQITVSQTTKDLDIKNGFRNFMLGSTPIQNKNIYKSEFQNPSFPSVVSYNYSGTDLESVFGVKVENIKLSFFKNKLFSINVDFGHLGESFELSEFNSILSFLEQVYGTKWQSPSNEDGIILNGAIWDAKNVKLELFRIDFSKSKTNPHEYGFVGGYINVIDKNLMKEMYKSNL
jgi:hypothetical protein